MTAWSGRPGCRLGALPPREWLADRGRKTQGWGWVRAEEGMGYNVSFVMTTAFGPLDGAVAGQCSARRRRGRHTATTAQGTAPLFRSRPRVQSGLGIGCVWRPLHPPQGARPGSRAHALARVGIWRDSLGAGHGFGPHTRSRHALGLAHAKGDGWPKAGRVCGAPDKLAVRVARRNGPAKDGGIGKGQAGQQSVVARDGGWGGLVGRRDGRAPSLPRGHQTLLCTR